APAAAFERSLPVPVVPAPEVLVVADPADQAGVRGEAGEVVAGLSLHLRPEWLLFRVGGAGEQEVLAHHEAEPVARIVEVLGFVDAAAPDAHIVDARGRVLFESPLVAVGVDSGEEDVVGNPVDALDPDRLAVDLQRVRPSLIVGFGVDLDGAEADPALPRVEFDAGAAQTHRDRVQRLIAATSGPPQFRVVDLDPDLGGALAGRQAGGGAPSGGLADQFDIGVRGLAQSDRQIDDAAAVLDADSRHDLVDP